MKLKIDPDKLNLLQAALLILSIIIALLILLLTAAWAVSSAFQTESEILMLTQKWLQQTWYMITIELIGLFLLSLILAYLLLLKKDKKSKYFVDPKDQPSGVETHKIVEFINKKKSITKHMLINEFKYKNKIAKRYLKDLVKNKYIKTKLTSKSLFKFKRHPEKEYILDEKGKSIIETMSNIKIQIPSFAKLNLPNL